MTLIPVLCHVSTKISFFVLLVCSKLDWHRTLLLDILAVIATRYCHYGDDRYLGSKIGRNAGRLGLMLCSRSLLQTVLELIGRNPGMLLAVRLDVCNRFRRCTSLVWLCLCHSTSSQSFGGGSTMMWRGITAHGRTPLVVVVGNLTGICYWNEIV
jgi:hypothetical protein